MGYGFGDRGGAVSSGGSRAIIDSRAAWASGCLAALLVTALALAPASARAEPLCTDTWTGPSEGTWTTAADWSAEHVPTSTDIACIGTGKVVKVSEGADQAAVVEGEGALSISGGSLELAGGIEEGGKLHALTLAGGTLEGAGALRVSGAFSWTGGTMSGSGSTVLESGVTSGAINPGAGKAVALTKRDLVNDGTLTWSSGSVEGRSSAEFENGGTFVANANVSGSEWSSHGLLNSDGSGVWLNNTGTIRKASGAEFTTIQFQIANEGTVEAQTGQIILYGGGHAGGTPSGSWLASEGASLSFNGGTYTLGEGVKFEGTSALAGGVIHASDIQGSKAHVYLWSTGGALELTGAATASHVKELTINSGTTLSGSATLDVSSELSWTGGTMSGSGSTVLEAGGTGSINPGVGSAVALTKRDLVNDGTLTWSSGSVEGRSSAEFENGGTFVANANVSGSEWSSHGLLNSDGSGVWLNNTGTIRKASGAEFTTIQFQISNEGTAEARTGQIIFSGGSHAGSTPSGSWSASEGASLSFNGGTYTFGEGVKLEGSVFLAGGVIHASDVQGPKAHVYLWSASGTLELTSAATASHVKELTVNRETTLDGAATLDVSSGFSWTGGTMSGTGTTSLEPGVLGSVAESAQPVLTKRRFVNEGSLTLPAESGISGKESATLINRGTLTVNAEGETRGPYDATPSTPPTLVNTGTVQKASGAGISQIGFVLDNEGTVSSLSGELELIGGGASGKEKTSSWSGSGGVVIFGTGKYALGATAKFIKGIIVSAAEVTVGKIEGPEAALAVTHVGSCCEHGVVEISGPGESTLSGLLLESGIVSGAGNVKISSSLHVQNGTLIGTGSTAIESGATGLFEGSVIDERPLTNGGVATWSTGYLEERNGARITNLGTFDANSETGSMAVGSGAAPSFVNEGTFQKTAGTGTTDIQVEFENYGAVRTFTGAFKFTHPVSVESASQYGGPEGSSAPGHPRVSCGDPVDCATGNLSESQTDFTVGGRGVGLDLTRTYNSQAGVEGAKGPFGYGWTSSFSDRLVIEKASKEVTLVQAGGGTVPFAEAGGEAFVAPAWTQDTLGGSEGAGYTLTLPDQTKYRFSGSNGRLESVTDRDGNATTLTYGEAGHLESITDPAGRKIKLTYNGEGLVEAAEDPMGHIVKYTYEGGNLESVTQPGKAGLRWQFKYDGSHQMTEMTDGRGGKTINEYNGTHQVTSQKDPAERKLKFEYEPFETRITNEATGSITDERFTSNDEPYAITRGYGTASATTESLTYNEAGYVTSTIDGNGHTTKYGYDAAGNRTSMVDPAGDETKWTYDAAHDIETTTTPRGETTTIKRDAHGNPEVIERPTPESKTQTTKYKYAAHGELESVTDPLEHTWKYGYDGDGDRTSETDPEGDKRTWEYNEDSQEIATVSPRGNVEGAEAVKYTTTTERDAQGRPLKITDPLGHTTKYTYDGDGNVETLTDGNGHTTTYVYNADNQPVKVKEPNGTVTETEYDGAGQVIAQIDGNKHKTKYARNILEEVTEVTDPLGRKTTKEYDDAGNLTSLTDPAKRTTTYKYDAANRLKEVTYSDGKTPTVKYTYDEDGDRTSMIDGTGATTYDYDQLDRLTETEDGNKEAVKYEYNLADEKTKVTYPNAKAITRAYDKDGRLEAVTDWLSNTTKFKYDPNSNTEATIFPSETKNEDKYAYNDADQMSEVKMLKGAEILASLAYTRDNDGQVKTTTTTGLPGPESTESTYDENNRLAKSSGTEYEYDAADNPTKVGSTTQTFDEASGLEKSTGATYSYDELGERAKDTPEKGPATTYGYDQAGNLTSVERPKEGEVSEIKDTYAYDGNGLRASQTINSTTSHLAWDQTEGLPLVLSDGANSYIYGPDELPIEQINNSTGAVFYLHHDQQGSTRMLTGATGAKEATFTYGAYGNTTGTTGAATTPLGYDGQYTSSDTGLIYLRARVYDPATAQFLSVDPLRAITGEPYAYAGDNPLNASDPMGLDFFEEAAEAVAGWGDAVTFGATKLAREELGINNVNECSAAYQAGGYAALATAVLIPGEGEAELGAEGLEETLTGLRESKANVYEVDSAEELQALYDELSHSGEPATPQGYDGEMVKLPNGTRVGLRNTSSSGGPALDIHQPGQSVIKVHLPNK